MTKTIEEQVAQACAPLKRFITRADKTNGSVFWNPAVEDYIDGDNSNVARLRLDFELSDDARENDSLADHMLAVFEPDLVDLLRNGDMTGSDALAKVLDGAVKRGVEAPKSVQIIEAVFYHDYMPKKESTEYTLFILLAVDW